MNRTKTWFPNIADYIHLAYGIVCGLLSILLPVASLILTINYIVYQLVEREPITETYNDLIEFLTGFVVGLESALIFFNKFLN